MRLPTFEGAGRGGGGWTLGFRRRGCRRVCAMCVLLLGASALFQTFSNFIYKQAYQYIPAARHQGFGVAGAWPTQSILEDARIHVERGQAGGAPLRRHRAAETATTIASSSRAVEPVGVALTRDNAEPKGTGHGRTAADTIPSAAIAAASIAAAVSATDSATLDITDAHGKRKVVKTVPPVEVLARRPQPNCTKVKRYVLLHWAPHWGQHRIPHGHNTLKDCPYDCLEWVQTSDRSYLPKADIVAVHDWTGSPALPAKAHANQLFMFITMESPFSPYSAQHKMHLFQLQYTYRLESDVRAAYIPIGISSFASISGPPAVLFSEKHDEAVSSLVSNCGGFVPRVKFMRELHQHIALHSYGRCFHNHNLPSHSDIHPLEKYKFAMVFENSLCHDYVTEKWWRALTQATIPLVTSYKNVPDYRKFGPTLHSYVNIADYADTKAVAERLKEIAHNEDLYDYYMEHRYMKRLDLNPLYLQNFANSTCDDFCRLTVQKLQVPEEMEKLLVCKIPRDTSCAKPRILKG